MCHIQLFRNKNRCRSCLDLKVGKSHVLEVTLHLRRGDYDWYSQHAKDVTQEFLDLLEQSVLPRMFGKEMEDYHKMVNPEVLGGGSGYEEDIGKVGAKNKRKKGNASAATATSKGNGGKKKLKSTSIAAACTTSTKKKSIAAGNDDTDLQEVTKERDVYYAFGEVIQLAYRRHPVTAATSHKTILYKQTQNHHQAPKTSISSSPPSASGFRDFLKLSHRLLIWISKIDPEQKTNPDPEGVGFYRGTELLPTSSLFRKPVDFLDDDDEDDDDTKRE
jgi:hypothetical protein